ncbi:MAG: hypothetical protein ACKVWR_07210 [Acidimicrobiales bacterium]
MTGNTVDISVAVEGYELTNTACKALVDGEGHYHLLLDGALVDMFITPDARFSMQNVAHGKHELAVVPAINDHTEVLDNEPKTTIDYQPTAPCPRSKTPSSPIPPPSRSCH